MAFQCVIVTPERQVLDASVTQAIVPAHDGLVGLLSGRAPLLVKLGMGPLRLDLAQGTSQYFLIEGGVAQMKDNRLTVLTTTATTTDEIDMETAQAEYAEAETRRATDEKSVEQRQRQMQRAKFKQEIKQRAGA